MTKLCKNRIIPRQSISPKRAFEGLSKTPAQLILHALLCIATFLLGFGLCREALVVVVSLKSPDSTFFSKSILNLHNIVNSSDSSRQRIALRLPYVNEGRPGSVPSSPLPEAKLQPTIGLRSSRVNVGRHEILIRSWPHPDPSQTTVAHRLMELVQEEQQRSYGLKERKQLIVITSTYVRTLQTVHLTCLSHTLQIVPGPLVWIVIEAGGVSNETAALLASSQISFHHLGFQEPMPAVWEERRPMEIKLRLEALSFIRQHRLDGITIFADESNLYSLDFFDEVQKVEWIGAFSMVVFSHSVLDKKNKSSSRLWLVQGPACNSTGHVSGLYSDMVTTSHSEIGSVQSLDWSSFAFNARLLWEEYQRPTWIKAWEECFGENQTYINSPLDFARNVSCIEPLGDCGRDVLLWKLQVEGSAGSKFPTRWVINPSLEVIVPSKRTPWPAVHPPPPVSADRMSFDKTNQHVKQKSKQGSKGTRGKRISHHVDSRKTDA